MPTPDRAIGRADVDPDVAAQAAPEHDGAGLAGIREYVALYKANEKRKRESKIASARMDQLEPGLIAWMQDNGMQNMKVDGATPHLMPATRAAKANPDVTPEDIIAALEADGLGDAYVKPGFNWQSLGAFVRECIEADDPLPPNLARVVRAVTTTTLNVRLS